MAPVFKGFPPCSPVPRPEAEIILYGRCKVTFAWNFTRKDPFWFLYCNPEPGACLKFGDRELRPSGSEILLIPPGTPFQSRCEKPFEHLYIHFNAGGIYTRVKPGPIVLERSVCGITDLLLKEQNVSPAALYALLFSALAAIPQERFAQEERSIDSRIQRAMLLLHQGMDNGELCRALGMSRSNFQRCFKAETGISPRHYAIMLRLEKAALELSSRKSSIGEIAQKYGFSDRYAFSKLFRKYAGVPPARYRSRSREDMHS